MSWIIGFVGSKVASLVASALAVMATIGLAFFSGRRSKAKDQEIENLKDYKKAMEAVDEVETDLDRASRIARLQLNGVVRKD